MFPDIVCRILGAHPYNLLFTSHISKNCTRDIKVLETIVWKWKKNHVGLIFHHIKIFLFVSFFLFSLFSIKFIKYFHTYESYMHIIVKYINIYNNDNVYYFCMHQFGHCTVTTWVVCSTFTVKNFLFYLFYPWVWQFWYYYSVTFAHVIKLR